MWDQFSVSPARSPPEVLLCLQFSWIKNSSWRFDCAAGIVPAAAFASSCPAHDPNNTTHSRTMSTVPFTPTVITPALAMRTHSRPFTRTCTRTCTPCCRLPRLVREDGRNVGLANEHVAISESCIEYVLDTHALSNRLKQAGLDIFPSVVALDGDLHSLAGRKGAPAAGGTMSSLSVVLVLFRSSSRNAGVLLVQPQCWCCGRGWKCGGPLAARVCAP